MGLGYGKEVHLRSGGVCLYCGFGVSWQVEPEIKFDACRQLTVEHIVPGQDGKLGRTIKMAVDGFFCDLPEDKKRKIKIIGLVKDLNEVTCCHQCNSLASRCSSTPPIREAIETFHNHLRVGDLGRGCLWIQRLRRDIWEVWHRKSGLVRAKLMILRRSFQTDRICALLDVPLADARPLATPWDLDDKLVHIMDKVLGAIPELMGDPDV